MSVSDDLLFDAPDTMAHLHAFLTEECELSVSEPSLVGSPGFECKQFYCFVTPLIDFQRKAFQDCLSFTPIWRMESYIWCADAEEMYRRIVDTFEMFAIQFDCNVAWLNDCTTPQLVKLGDQLTVQADYSPYSHFADLLDRSAKRIGIPYTTKLIPSL